MDLSQVTTEDLINELRRRKVGVKFTFPKPDPSTIAGWLEIAWLTGPMTAMSIVQRYKTLDELLAMTYGDLLQINGVGVSTARKILKQRNKWVGKPENRRLPFPQSSGDNS